MSFIRASSDRKYSKGGIMYVINSNEGIVYYAGNPQRPEDLMELIGRIVEQAGVNLSDSDVESIRERLGLPEKDYPETNKPASEPEELKELLDNGLEMTEEQVPDLSGDGKTGEEERR